MEEQVLNGKKELASLSVKDLFFKYIRFLPLFIIVIALSLFVAYVYLRYATLIYASTGTLVVRDEKTSGGPSGDRFEQLLVSDGRKNIQNEIEYLKSRPLMERVVRGLNLNFSYFALGNIKELNIYNSSPFRVEAFQIADSNASFSLQIDFVTESSFRVNKSERVFAFGQVFQNSHGVFRMVRNPWGGIGSAYQVKWHPTIAVASSLQGSLVIAPKANTGILVLSMEATNPTLAADVINKLMEVYQQATIEDKNVATENTIEFIDDRLKVVQRELDSINYASLLFQQQHNIIEPEAQSTNYLSRIEDALRESSVQTMQLNNAEMIDDYLRNKQYSDQLVPSVLGIEDPTLTEMIGAYNKAQLERQRLLENAPPGNVAVKQLGEEIETVRKKILENLVTIKSAYRSAINQIQNRGASAQSAVKLLPEKIQRYADIKRAQSTKLLVYNTLMQKREESAIALASTISNTKVLQDAQPSATPIAPKRRNTQILAILIGIALPGIFIFVAEIMNDKVTTRNDIERITNATILGEVGHSYGKDALVVTHNNRKIVAEQFRILRSNLQYVLNHIQKPVILVTSSFSGEGKSFISTNMGAVMAVTGKRTIILEFDIRKPKVLSHLNMARRPGLTNYLLGKVRLEDLPVPVEGSDNLFVLPCGPVPPNPAELLLDKKLDDLFDYLRAEFDVVIMDTAPVGMVSDALTLSRFADCTLYIVRQGHTYKKQIGMVDEFYQAGKLPKINIILNDVKVRSGYGYYGNGRYGYGYGSGYFDDDDAPPPGMLGKWFGWLDMKKWNQRKKRKTSKAG